MTPDQAREIIRPIYDALTRPAEKDVTALLTAALTETWQSLGSPPDRSDRAHFIQKVIGFGKAIPDLCFAIQEVLVAGDRVIVRSLATGTPAGDFMGVPHSGKSFAIMTIDIHRIANGKADEVYHVEDWISALRQLRD